MPQNDVEKLFPFDSFRHKQKEVTEAAIKALYENGYSNVVIDAPVGSGKSAILTSVLRRADSGFYTTPQKSLREQIQNDPVLQEYVRSLKARRDYVCGVTGSNCEDCSINQSSDKSCSKQGNCTYWKAKLGAMNHPIAVLTFSYIIIDSMIPTEIEEMQISFDDRDILCVDEAHNLIEQTASLQAGYKISPYSLPKTVFGSATTSAPLEATKYQDVESEVETIRRRCKDYIPSGIPEVDMEPSEKRCKRLVDKIEWMQEEIDNGKPWVVDVERKRYGGQQVKILELTPVYVGNFLNQFLWNRANKRVISTATMPYRANPSIWIKNLGLDPEDTQVISVGMAFPVENRPIHTDTMISKMSSGGVSENWDSILETVDGLAERHHNQKGLIHGGSYDRCQEFADRINKEDYPYLYENVIPDKQERDSSTVVEEWQDSDHNILVSPRMMEGVDLKGDMCRWQVLLKAPIPSRSSRIDYILNEEDWGWPYYWERTMIRIAQSYGRAIRSPDDFADYYVLDKDFERVLDKRQAPRWMTEAIDTGTSPSSQGLFDY